MFHLCCIKVITATQAYGGLVCVDIYIYAFVCICLTCHQCFTSASPVFHQYFTSVVPVFHKCLTTVVPVFHQYFTSASSVLCQWFISVSPVSQMSSKYFIRQNNHGIRFYSTSKCLGETSIKKNGKKNDIVHLSNYPHPPGLIVTAVRVTNHIN